eukprot:1008834-Amorphochlora_amoeboformis.AAC.1
MNIRLLRMGQRQSYWFWLPITSPSWYLNKFEFHSSHRIASHSHRFPSHHEYMYIREDSLELPRCLYRDTSSFIVKKDNNTLTIRLKTAAADIWELQAVWGVGMRT